jgi:hypothetical protein
MKTNGATWNAYLESWPEGQWYEDSDETINGTPCDDVANIDSDAVVEFTCGVVFKNEKDFEGFDLVRHFKAWLKARDTVSVVVSVAKDQEQALRDFVKSIKGKTQ